MRKPPNEIVWAVAGVGPNVGTAVPSMQPKATAADAKNRRLRDPQATFVPEPEFPKNASISCPPPCIKKYGNIVHQESRKSNR